MIDQVRALITAIVTDWERLDVSALKFAHADDARVALTALLVTCAILAILRTMVRRRPGRHRIAMPALLASLPVSRFSVLIYAPTLLFALGVPFFFLALADPFTAMVSEDVSYPGRRIAVVIDASASGIKAFPTRTLKTRGPNSSVFYTNTAAAERFVQLRARGKYRDLIALLEFGNQAYVITPFTHDYDNILLSISLIADPTEWYLFPDTGTIIAQALEQSVELFKAFNFLEASGNMMVIFSDGEDTTAIVNGRSLDDILQAAVVNKIPLYFVRTNFGSNLGGMISDRMWRDAVEKTGGKFFVAHDEPSLLQAIDEIDSVSAGTIQTKRYSRQEPQFASFAAIAVALWLGSAALKLTSRYFQKLP